MFLFTTAFNSIFRWLAGAILGKDHSLPSFPHPSCAYADDFVVVACSVRILMPIIADTFRKIDVTGMNLDHKKCYWIRYGLIAWDLRDCQSCVCPSFTELQVMTFDKHLGRMIAPEGHCHWWSPPLNDVWADCARIIASPKKSCPEAGCFWRSRASSLVVYRLCRPDPSNRPLGILGPRMSGGAKKRGSNPGTAKMSMERSKGRSDVA